MAPNTSAESRPDPTGPGRLRRRTPVVAALAALAVGLAGCGDPDDGDGGGGGYVTVGGTASALEMR